MSKKHLKAKGLTCENNFMTIANFTTNPTVDELLYKSPCPMLNGVQAPSSETEEVVN